MSKKVLVACEYSQIVTSAFLEVGADAYSCDIIETTGPYPKRHFKMDALECANAIDWDLIIAHPPCTYMCVASARHMYKGGSLFLPRFEQAMKAKDFFLQFLSIDKCPVCVENPIPLKVVQLPTETQRFCVTQFGEHYSKKVCLWLKDLPPLIPYVDCVLHHTQFVKRGHNGHSRSKFFPNVAKAMAEQWYPIL